MTGWWELEATSPGADDEQALALLRYPVIGRLEHPPGDGVAEVLEPADDVQEVGPLGGSSQAGHVFQQERRRADVGHRSHELGDAIARVVVRQPLAPDRKGLARGPPATRAT